MGKLYDVLKERYLMLMSIWPNDPIRCKVYQDKGCAHIDGLLCDYPGCQILKDYLKEKDNE